MQTRSKNFLKALGILPHWAELDALQLQYFGAAGHITSRWAYRKPSEVVILVSQQAQTMEKSKGRCVLGVENSMTAMSLKSDSSQKLAKEKETLPRARIGDRKEKGASVDHRLFKRTSHW